MQKTYIAIDLKSFYASVECKARDLDPLTTNLVVADESRTEKTICLAVSPSLKSYGISGRARLFEVIQRVDEVNARRQWENRGKAFEGSSCQYPDLCRNPKLKVDYIVAAPRMSFYSKISTQIYNIYLRYIAPEDMHPYSIDEVIMDVTGYLDTYKMTAHDLARTMIRDVLKETGITATAGIGTNMYLCKIAMDVWAKHTQADADGVRIAELDEMSYRRLLWHHQPLTDFWRVGRGIQKKLAEHGIYTMGDIARCSIGSEHDYYNEELLYKLFGVNAELLIDHAWGYEPCEMKHIKAYKPANTSINSGQVLPCAYTADQTRLVVWEMADNLSLSLVDKHLVTDQIVLTIGYDIENLTDSDRRRQYKGEIVIDRYGRRIPKHAHGTGNLPKFTSSTQMIIDAAMDLYDRIIDRNLLVRRLAIVANHLMDEKEVVEEQEYKQLSLFDLMGTEVDRQESVDCGRKTQEFHRDDSQGQQYKQDIASEKEKNLQEAMLQIKKKFGKNAILKGSNLQEGATARDRNATMGGHKA